MNPSSKEIHFHPNSLSSEGHDDDDDDDDDNNNNNKDEENRSMHSLSSSSIQQKTSTTIEDEQRDADASLHRREEDDEGIQDELIPSNLTISNTQLSPPSSFLSSPSAVHEEEEDDGRMEAQNENEDDTHKIKATHVDTQSYTRTNASETYRNNPSVVQSLIGSKPAVPAQEDSSQTKAIFDCTISMPFDDRNPRLPMMEKQQQQQQNRPNDHSILSTQQGQENHDGHLVTDALMEKYQPPEDTQHVGATNPGAIAVGGEMSNGYQQPTTRRGRDDTTSTTLTSSELVEVLTVTHREEHLQQQEEQFSIQSTRHQFTTTTSPQGVQNHDIEDPTPVLVEAEEYNANHVITTAELLSPSTLQVFEVDIDGDHHHYRHQTQERQGCSSTSTSKESISNSKWKWMCLGATITILLLVAIGTPIGVRHSKTKINTPNGSPQLQHTNPPAYSYPCYTSTRQIAVDQLTLDILPKAFILCPNTYIKLGVLRNPSANDFEFINGDYPLIPFKDDVTIQCGLDGSRTNNCTLEGGLLQILAQTQIPYPGHGVINVTSAHNFTVRGITFTGEIAVSGAVHGISVTLSVPAQNVLIEDCAWNDMTAPFGLISVSRNLYLVYLDLPLSDNVIHVTIRHCLFTNIVYDLQLISTLNQELHLEDLQFENIQLSFVRYASCWVSNQISSAYPDSVTSSIAVQAEDCRGLFYCYGNHSICTMNNLCVQDMQISGPAPIVICNQSQFTSNGQNLWRQQQQQQSQQQTLLPTAQVNNSCMYGAALLNDSLLVFRCDTKVFDHTYLDACVW